MKPHASFSWLGVGALIAAACSSGGDTSSTSTTGSGGAAGATQGGSAQGGSSGTAQAGNTQAGNTQAGGAQAGSAQGGKGGGASDCCATVKCGGSNPMCVAGSCFDLKAGECFSSSDCGGAECVGATVCPCDQECFAPTKPGHCAGSSSGWATCGAPGECALAPDGCCGACGQPTVAEVDAVNRAKLAEHHAAVCNDPTPACPKCPSATNPDLLAACALGPGKCVVVEVSKNPLSLCQTDADCKLRAPQCCSCGEVPASGLVAIAKSLENAYTKELGCENVDCAPCAEPPTVPAGVKAVCELGTHHCKVSGG